MDPDFDLDYHVRRVRLPEPGTMEQLLELAQTQAVVPIDRNRPPWIRLFVEGFEGDKAATIFQCQHVLTDGFAYAQLMSRLYKPAPVMDVKLPGRPLPEPEGIDPLGLTVKRLRRAVRSSPRLAGKAVSGAVHAATHPRYSAEYARSLRRVVEPPPASTSKLLGGGARTKWRFGTLECEMDELKQAGRAAGGSLNDAFVSATLGGIRHYHERVGAEIGDIPISMPVAMRTGDEAKEGGNKFAGAFFTAPAGDPDPAERITRMRAAVDQLRGEPALDFIGQLTPVMNRAPSAVVAAAIGRLNASVDLTLSNWPGVRNPIYIREARLDRMFVFGPLPGTAMTAALNTHAGRCCIGINSDGDVFEDTELLSKCMQQGLDEVLSLSG
jgi:WS/DGAT/MGAT family acyltransferase